MLTILGILALVYIALKVYNTLDEFRKQDARAAAEQRAREAAMEEEEEEAEIRANAIDVEAEVEDDAEEFFVEEPAGVVDLEEETAKIRETETV